MAPAQDRQLSRVATEGWSPSVVAFRGDQAALCISMALATGRQWLPRFHETPTFQFCYCNCRPLPGTPGAPSVILVGV